MNNRYGEQKIGRNDTIDNELFEVSDSMKNIFEQAFFKIKKFLLKYNIVNIAENIPPLLFTKNSSKLAYYSNGKVVVWEGIVFKGATYIEYVFTHEILHAVSYNSIGLLKDTVRVRGGVKLQNLKKFSGVIDEINFSDVQTLFQGFNEGITEMFTQSIVGTEGQPDEFSYQDEVDLVYELLKQICGKNKKCYTELAQDYFFGSFIFMQKVKQIYGKGSIKLLSELKTEEYINGLDISCFEKIELLKRRKEILNFFITNDVDKREELRSKLLDNETNAKAHNKQI